MASHFFLESSAYFKLFAREPGSEAMIALVEATDEHMLAISSITPLEVKSAIRRRQLWGDTTVAEAEQAFARIDQESGRIFQLPFTPLLIRQASEVILHCDLRALDAIQLASALQYQHSLLGATVTFVVSDKKLIVAAQQLGMNVLDPAR